MAFVKRAFAYVKNLPLRYSVSGAVALVLIVIAAVHFLGSSVSAPADTAAGTPQVMVATVAALASESGPLPVTGTVTSLTQATILSQTSGQITSLPRELGDSVAAGAVIGTFENASQQAALLQAEGAYDAANASLAKVMGNSAQNTTASTIAALVSGYAAIDDAVHTRADQLFTNARTNPQLVITVPDSALANRIVRERGSLDAVVDDMRSLASSTASDNVAAGVAQATADVSQIVAFLDDLIRAVNETQPSQAVSSTELAAYQTSLATARSEAAGVLSGIATAKTAYDANDAAAAQAALKQASGALDAAKANIEKTIIRSPVSGTIVSLPVSLGDYVNANTEVAVVSNPHALYVDAAVTSSDAETLSIGGKAVIDGNVSGTITFIAPAIDPSTGKIEIKVGITGNAATLADGETVSLSLARASVVHAPAPSVLTIPIVAAKILPSGPAVFTVSTSSALVAHPITLGTILGDRVIVLSGLTPDMQIVTDARGLASGETVLVATSSAP